MTEGQQSDDGPTIEAYYLRPDISPPAECQGRALVATTALPGGGADWQGFWAEQAEALSTGPPWDTISSGSCRSPSGSSAAKLNVSYNCLDRHVAAGPGRPGRLPLGGRAGRHPDHHLRRAARRGRSASPTCCKSLGVQRGDRVAIYMPMIPELPVAMLACTRIGAAHSVVFGGFSSDALRDRINDAEAKVLVTADGGWRRGRPSLLKPAADVAVSAETPSIEHVVVVRRTGADVAMTEGRDHWWHDLMAEADADVRAGADGRRGPAVPPVHQRHHGQAQGHHAHHRRLPDPGGLHPQVRLRPPPRAATSTGARPTSAGSPATATSSTGRWPTAPPA